jgi:hypothetical protein
MGKVGEVEQMLDGLKEWKNGTLSKSVGFCTNFGRQRVASFACHLILINTPFRAYLAHPFRHRWLTHCKSSNQHGQ